MIHVLDKLSSGQLTLLLLVLIVATAMAVTSVAASISRIGHRHHAPAEVKADDAEVRQPELPGPPAGW